MEEYLSESNRRRAFMLAGESQAVNENLCRKPSPENLRQRLVSPKSQEMLVSLSETTGTWEKKPHKDKTLPV